MDLQEYLSNMSKAARSRTLANSIQLTLGELLLKLEPLIKKYSDKKPEDTPSVSFDFGSAVPTTFASWRGSYEEIALGYNLTGYDGNGENTDLVSFHKMVESAIGQTFVGWKGGDFTMSKNTPVWVANPGNSGNSGIIEVLDLGYQIILLTGFCEY